jgi:hypothetical protein
MTFDEFKTEFLATVNLDEYKKQDSYIQEMWESGRLAAIATSIKGKYIHSVLNDLTIHDVTLEEYRELKALTLKCVKEDRLDSRLKELEEDFQ